MKIDEARAARCLKRHAMSAMRRASAVYNPDQRGLRRRLPAGGRTSICITRAISLSTAFRPPNLAAYKFYN